jgi:hypothetical protein
MSDGLTQRFYIEYNAPFFFVLTDQLIVKCRARMESVRSRGFIPYQIDNTFFTFLTMCLTIA